MQNMVTEISMEGRIGKSDHDVVVFKMWVNKPKSENLRLLTNYKKAKFDKMREAVGLDDYNVW